MNDPKAIFTFPEYELRRIAVHWDGGRGFECFDPIRGYSDAREERDVPRREEKFDWALRTARAYAYECNKRWEADYYAASKWTPERMESNAEKEI